MLDHSCLRRGADGTGWSARDIAVKGRIEPESSTWRWPSSTHRLRVATSRGKGVSISAAIPTYSAPRLRRTIRKKVPPFERWEFWHQSSLTCLPHSHHHPQSHLRCNRFKPAQVHAGSPLSLWHLSSRSNTHLSIFGRHTREQNVVHHSFRFLVSVQVTVGEQRSTRLLQDDTSAALVQCLEAFERCGTPRRVATKVQVAMAVGRHARHAQLLPNSSL